MWNDIVFRHLLAKYGIDAMIEYCELHSEGCQMVYDIRNNEKGDSYESYADYGYDAQWWKKKGEELKNIKNENSARTAS